MADKWCWWAMGNGPLSLYCSVPSNILVGPGCSAWAALLNTRIENKNILVFGSAAQADLPNRTRIFGGTLYFWLDNFKTYMGQNYNFVPHLSSFCPTTIYCEMQIQDWISCLDKKRTNLRHAGVQVLSTLRPAAGWPGRKWKNNSVLVMTRICPEGFPWSWCSKEDRMGTIPNQQWQKLDQIGTKLRTKLLGWV